MRTTLFLLAGLCLLTSALILGKLFVTNYPSATRVTVTVFIVVWLLATAFNMWVGVKRAGYSFGEELPVFLMLFAVPTAVALLLRWKLP